jgi:oxysterol-binding protein 1
VTTNVSGFIMGSPTIDHYGDMVVCARFLSLVNIMSHGVLFLVFQVTNHRTGDKCILTFKPRGWRGRDAFEISGVVNDSKGNIIFEIAGRWNSQLIARRVGTGSGVLNPDSSMDSSPEYILLWRNSEKPAGSPFNLTPYAITLNACPDTLKPYLCPTDCRLRRDQRAFEMGKYELANDLKTAQEEKQRAIRKMREDGKRERHKPRWFRAETDGDTGERVWAPSRVGESEERDGELEYWVERERIWREIKEGKKWEEVKWKNVDDIFIEEPEEIKNVAW